MAAGGCRSSGWAMVLLAFVLLALVLLAGLWVWGFFSVSLCEGAPGPFFLCRYRPRCSGTLVPCIRSRESAGLLVVCVVTDQMVGARRSLGRQNWGARLCTPSANHRLLGPPTGSEVRDGSCCGLCTRRLALYLQTGATLRRHFLRAFLFWFLFLPLAKRPELGGGGIIAA